MPRNLVLCIALLLACVCRQAGAAAGTADPTFANAGVLQYDTTSWQGALANPVDSSFVLIQTGNAPLFSGGVMPANQTIRRWDGFGRPDATYGSNGVATAPIPVQGATFDRHGRLVLAGNGQLARLTTRGLPDESFGRPSYRIFAGSDTPRAMLVQPDGKILLLLRIDDTFVTRFAFVRFLDDGTPDSDFNRNAYNTSPLQGRDLPTWLGLLPDGRIVATGMGFGYFPSLFGNGVVWRLNADGTPDAWFGSGGKRVFAEFGEVLYAGVFIDGRALLVAKTSAGTVRNWYMDQTGSTLTASATEVRSTPAVGADGKLHAFTGANTVGRFDALGRVDPGWGSNGVAGVALPEQATYNRAVLHPGLDGKVLVTATTPTLDLSGTFPGPVHVVRLQADEERRTVVEFFDTRLNHYFMTALPEHQALVDAGAAGPDWIRTGFSFKSGGPGRVCRYYSPVPYHDSHFFSVNPAECAQAALDARWQFESYDFNAWPPGPDGSCRAGFVPVYRAVNNRAHLTDHNQRHTTDLAEYQRQLARGWGGEGVVMCVPQ